MSGFEWHWTPHYAHYLFAFSGLVATGTDLWRQKIYNALTLPTLILGIALNSFQWGWQGLGSSLWGFALAACVYLVLGLMGAMKGGDLKLAAAMGACLGWPLTLGALFYGFIFGGLLAVLWAALHGTLGSSLRKVGLSFFARLVPGMKPELELAESASPPMPYGAAIALGGVLVQWYIPAAYLPGL